MPVRRLPSARRLTLLVALVVAPALAACGNVTSPDDPSTNPPPADTTGRKEVWPWG